MSSGSRDGFASFSKLGHMLFLFSCLFAMARTSRAMSSSSGKRGHLCLVPDLGEKDSVFLN